MNQGIPALLLLGLAACKSDRTGVSKAAPSTKPEVHSVSPPKIPLPPSQLPTLKQEDIDAASKALAELKKLPSDFIGDDVDLIARETAPSLKDGGHLLGFISAFDRQVPPSVPAAVAQPFLSDLFARVGMASLDPECRELPGIAAGWTLPSRLTFALGKAHEFPAEGNDWLAWAKWMSSLQAPLDDKHPLSALGARAADFSGRPEWLLQLPEGETRTLAISGYMTGLGAKGNWDTAFTWLPQIPAGPARQEVAKRLERSIDDGPIHRDVPIHRAEE